MKEKLDSHFISLHFYFSWGVRFLVHFFYFVKLPIRNLLNVITMKSAVQLSVALVAFHSYKIWRKKVSKKHTKRRNLCRNLEHILLIR